MNFKKIFPLLVFEHGYLSKYFPLVIRYYTGVHNIPIEGSASQIFFILVLSLYSTAILLALKEWPLPFDSMAFFPCR